MASERTLRKREEATRSWKLVATRSDGKVYQLPYNLALKANREYDARNMITVKTREKRR
jgi:hypothetical protein